MKIFTFKCSLHVYIIGEQKHLKNKGILFQKISEKVRQNIKIQK